MDSLSKWEQLLGRIALGAIFVISALGKLANWSGTAGYAASKGVGGVALAVATALELLGGISVIVGYKTRWGALALLVFLVPVTLVFHHFWGLPADQQQQQIVEFLKNLGLAGGLLLVLAHGAGAYSVDARRAGAADQPLSTPAAR